MIQQNLEQRPRCPEAVPDLIPVRMLNEFTYCPRLGYLEWVEGEWAENLETMQGTFGHRRVDRPDRQSIATPAGNAADDSAAAAADADALGTPEPRVELAQERRSVIAAHRMRSAGELRPDVLMYLTGALERFAGMSINRGLSPHT